MPLLYRLSGYNIGNTRVLLLSTDSSGGLSVTRDAGKTQCQPMACAAKHCSWQNPAWLTYTASGNIAFCLKTDTVFMCLVTLTFDLPM